MLDSTSLCRGININLAWAHDLKSTEDTVSVMFQGLAHFFLLLLFGYFCVEGESEVDIEKNEKKNIFNNNYSGLERRAHVAQREE